MKKWMAVIGMVCWAATLAFAGENQPSKPWVAFGQVTDGKGGGMPGVAIHASCGWKSLRTTGNAVSDAEGNYRLAFGPGMLSVGKDGKTNPQDTRFQAAMITARRTGFSEKNLSRHGSLWMAGRMPGEGDRRSARPEQIILPNEPRRIDFVMLPTASLLLQVLDGKGDPIRGIAVTVNGAAMPPGASVLAQPRPTDKDGILRLDGIPTNYTWRLNLGEDLYADVPISSPGPNRITLRTALHPKGGYRHLQVVSHLDAGGNKVPVAVPPPGPPWVGRHGLQCRMQAQRFRWAPSETPVLLAEVQNLHGRSPRIPGIQERWTLEMDGKKYRWSGACVPDYRTLQAGELLAYIRFTLDASWVDDGGKPLAWTPGRHQLRISTRYGHSTGSGWIGSNFVTVEIKP
ncbi:MAG: carboxypeptidase-like regulatory domain-containing protein [Planctomycetota bacterium]|jgi:hypothetical protein